MSDTKSTPVPPRTEHLSNTAPTPLSKNVDTGYIALGSNMGDRLAILRGAVRELDALENTGITDASPVYEAEAHTLGDNSAPPYLNAVVRFKTELSPEHLLAGCLRIERNAGRRRDPDRPWTSRSLDLDILTWGERTIQQPGLTIPHPRMHERRFVLRPLLDLDPDLHLPEPYDTSVRYLLSQCTDTAAIHAVSETLIDA